MATILPPSASERIEIVLSCNDKAQDGNCGNAQDIQHDDMMTYKVNSNQLHWKICTGVRI